MAIAAFDLLLENVHLATLRDPAGYGAIRDAALGIAAGRIAWLGPARDLPLAAHATTRRSCGGRWATPGLVDCHTHLVYAGNRADEFERRLHGATYADIARSGGGINATVCATRDASDDSLGEESRARLVQLADEGVTTVEIKSGYGQDTANEAKQLAVARRIGDACGVDVRTTLLAAHALPAGYSGRADNFIDYVCGEMIPVIAKSGLADAADAFCETIGFTPGETRRVLECARAHALPVKLHADQLSDQGGAALAAEFGALSADHLEYANEAGIAAMARAGTVAVLLPGAWYSLRETRLPPVDLLRRHAVPIAVATDCNPGSSPTASLPLMLNMACVLFGLTPAEALAGATKHAALALGLADRGRLDVGLRADIALWDIAEPAELAYWFGGNRCAGIVRAGELQRWSA